MNSTATTTQGATTMTSTRNLIGYNPDTETEYIIGPATPEQIEASDASEPTGYILVCVESNNGADISEGDVVRSGSWEAQNCRTVNAYVEA